jgi:hypothetical protein
MWTDIHKNKLFFGNESRQDLKLNRGKTPILEKEIATNEFH